MDPPAMIHHFIRNFTFSDTENLAPLAHRSF